MLREFMPQKPAQLSTEQLDKVVKEVLKANDLKKAEGKNVGRIISCVAWCLSCCSSGLRVSLRKLTPRRARRLVREQTGDRAEAKDVAEAVRRIQLP